ncbi:MAG: pilus assembly protein [Rhizobiales bacterium]|nr:pilus assembly protein [Hyphomicrobiales bacterium]
MTNAVAKSVRLLRYHLARFSRRSEGLAAIEFAMILPLMLVTLFGMIGTTSAISIDRKVTLIARTLSDLTSQGSIVTGTGTGTDISNFFQIGRAMLTPYNSVQNPFSGGPLKMTITEIYINPTSGAARVQWSWGDVQRAVGSVVTTMPTDLIGKDASGKVLPDQYFILSEVSYLYAPSILPGVATVQLKESTYTRPRLSKPVCVLYNPGSASDPCPTN